MAAAIASPWASGAPRREGITARAGRARPRHTDAGAPNARDRTRRGTASPRRSSGFAPPLAFIATLCSRRATSGVLPCTGRPEPTHAARAVTHALRLVAHARSSNRTPTACTPTRATRRFPRVGKGVPRHASGLPPHVTFPPRQVTSSPRGATCPPRKCHSAPTHCERPSTSSAREATRWRLTPTRCGVEPTLRLSRGTAFHARRTLRRPQHDLEIGAPRPSLVRSLSRGR